MSEYFEIHSAEYEEALEILYGGEDKAEESAFPKKLKKVLTLR